MIDHQLPDAPGVRDVARAPSRRTVLGAAAWTAPLVVMASAAPAYAVSNPVTSLQVLDSAGNIVTGAGFVRMLLTPDPDPVPAAQSTTYDDPGTTTTTFFREGASGDGAIYRLAFETTTVPVPATITATIAVPGFGNAVVPVTMTNTGTLDATFADPGLNSSAFAVALQSDGKVVVAGAFTAADGATRGRLARYDVDGNLDTSFADPALDDTARGVAIDSVGRILVCGDFTSAGGQQRAGLARFDTDGSLDATFADPNLEFGLGGGLAVAVDSADRVLVAGTFSFAGASEVPRQRLARFTTSGALDTTFADPGLNATARGVAVDSAGRVLVTGNFTTAGGATRSRLARFLPTGVLDTTFVDPNLNGTGYAVAVDAADRVLVTGEFTTAGAGDTPQRYLARLNTDGTQYPTFANPDSNGFGRALAVAPDGKILLAGLFSTAGGHVRAKLARYRTDGILDFAFQNPELDNNAQGVAVAADGNVIVAGTFQNVGGTPRARLARILG
jgi:uncharacterized delta-60 repeat protein